MKDNLEQLFRPTAFAMTTGIVYLALGATMNTINGYENPVTIATGIHATLAGASAAIADLIFEFR